ncbi:MAG: ribonuclease HI [Betaproteobacteria bacterium]|nr:ribonuclease HI [Betaproteobacteria bacterium]
MERVEIYTDGACKGNPGPGGWGVVLRFGEQVKELFGGQANTTNNRMELTAAIEALKALRRPVSASIYTDSQYLIKGLEQWLPAWKARASEHQLSWHWVKGHAGNPGNTRADALANRGVERFGKE